ncbi:hypothetical protein Hanom_Chr04g00297601 [Helianthus anomalus]
MLTPLGRSFLNTFWSENLAGVSTGCGGGGFWAVVGATAGGLYGWEREGGREMGGLGWRWLQQVAVGWMLVVDIERDVCLYEGERVHTSLGFIYIFFIILNKSLR